MSKPFKPISHKQYAERAFNRGGSSSQSSPNTPESPFSTEFDSDSSSYKQHKRDVRLAEPDLSISPQYKETSHSSRSRWHQQNQPPASYRSVPSSIRSYNTTSSTNSDTQMRKHIRAPSYSEEDENPFESGTSNYIDPKLDNKSVKSQDTQNTYIRSLTNSSVAESSVVIPLKEINSTRSQSIRKLPPGFGDSRDSCEFVEVFDYERKSKRHTRRRTPCGFIPWSKKFCVGISFIIGLALLVLFCIFYPKVPSTYISSIQVLSGPIASDLKKSPPTFNISTSLTIGFDNYNQYPVTVSNLDINAYFIDGSNSLGQTTAHNIHLASSRVTFVTIPFNISYSQQMPNDDTWTALVFACDPDLLRLPHKNSMILRFVNTISAPPLSWLGKKSRVQWRGDFVCPDK
ncbi:hypothetical protein K7432_012342 [Basidiobolus ranarum]|uniref:Late embryogenesis abundant protein LEA-2 subgroup domain-containing protein n=1 Tax=Basidiobolus ranarum TaxID=34480 RepID=A0ABR2VTA0_9FUNG